VFNENEPSNLILELKPAFYVKGPDYKNVVLPESVAVERAGCKLVIHPVLKEYNSSNLIHSLPIDVFRKARE
jgi:bifunctional ADP-heptose synthase (sugar kinase/adenylyltransferase)